MLLLPQKQPFNSVTEHVKILKTKLKPTWSKPSIVFSPGVMHDNYLASTGSKKPLCNSNELLFLILCNYFSDSNSPLEQERKQRDPIAQVYRVL